MSKIATYIVAVSGGIDSVCLLHAAVTNDPMLDMVLPEQVRLVVAHVNHGIRGEESVRDEDFVKGLADRYSLTFESINLNLDKDASEEKAREGRYKFLDEICHKYHANGIMLAHHQGDVLETAIINIVRGTGRRGMSSLKTTSNRIRPFLKHSKLHLHQYAALHNLKWVEDSTNTSNRYLRNRIRFALDNASAEKSQQALAMLSQFNTKNDLIDREIANILQYKLKNNAIISRNWFVKLPHIIATEVIHSLLQKLSIANIDRELVERLVVAIKVGKPGKLIDIDKSNVGAITKRSMRIIDRSTLKARTL